MRKLTNIYISIALIILAIPFTGNSQLLGIRTGVNISNISFQIKEIKGSTLANSLAGISLNFNSNYQIANQHKLNIELQYFRKGYYYRIKNYNYQKEEKASFKIDYLQANLIYEWTPFIKIKSKSKKNKLYLFTGGYFAYKIAAKWKYLEVITQNSNLVQKYRNTDFGLIFGGGIQNISFLRKEFTIDARVYLGVQNIIKHSFYQMYNRNFEIGVKYTLF